LPLHCQQQIVTMAAVISSKASTFVRGTAVCRPSRAAARRTSRVATPVRAKYGEESQYFDLDDLENTLGSWDLYGQDSEKRYNGLQSEFFERAAAPLTRRESVLAFIALGGVAGILTWGAKGSKDVGLPIQVGPKGSGEAGPRGKI